MDTSTYNHQDFLKQVEEGVSPLYEECFSDQTTNTRNLSLAASLVLVLVVVEVVAFTGNFELLGASLTIQSNLIIVLLCMCSYFLVTFSMRSYSEWKIWRLKQQAEIVKVKELSNTLSSKYLAYAKSIQEMMNESVELLSKSRSSILLKVDDVDDPIYKARERLAFLSEEHDRLSNAVEKEQIEQNISYLDDALTGAKRVMRFRLIWEMIIPILFGIAAILVGIGKLI